MPFKLNPTADTQDNESELISLQEMDGSVHELNPLHYNPSYSSGHEPEPLHYNPSSIDQQSSAVFEWLDREQPQTPLQLATSPQLQIPQPSTPMAINSQFPIPSQALLQSTVPITVPNLQLNLALPQEKLGTSHQHVFFRLPQANNKLKGGDLGFIGRSQLVSDTSIQSNSNTNSNSNNLLPNKNTNSNTNNRKQINDSNKAASSTQKKRKKPEPTQLNGSNKTTKSELIPLKFMNLPKLLKPIEDAIENGTPTKRWFFTLEEQKLEAFTTTIEKYPLFEENIRARQLTFGLDDYNTEEGFLLCSKDPQGWNIFISVMIATTEKVRLKPNGSEANSNEDPTDEPRSKKRKLNAPIENSSKNMGFSKKAKYISFKELRDLFITELPNDGGYFAIIPCKMDVAKLTRFLRDKKSKKTNNLDLFDAFERHKLKLIVYFHNNQWGIALVSTKVEVLSSEVPAKKTTLNSEVPTTILTEFQHLIDLKLANRLKEDLPSKQNVATTQSLAVVTPQIISNKDKPNPVLSAGVFAPQTKPQNSSNTNRGFTSSDSTPNYP